MSTFILRAMLPQLLGRGLDGAHAVISFFGFGLGCLYQRVTFESDLITGMRTAKMVATSGGVKNENPHTKTGVFTSREAECAYRVAALSIPRKHENRQSKVKN